MIGQVKTINGVKTVVPLSNEVATDSVASGNMEPVSSNAVANAISYSETEHQVGYWIDGSPLYERTVLANIPNNGTYSISISTSHKVKRWSGNFFQGSIENYSFILHIPYSYLYGTPLADWLCIYVYEQSNGFILNFMGGGQYVTRYYNGVAVITYQYTKA